MRFFMVLVHSSLLLLLFSCLEECWLASLLEVNYTLPQADIF